MSLLAAFTATVLGAVLGAALLGAASVPAASAPAPRAWCCCAACSDVVGRCVPTVLNIAQNIGWGTIEIIVIAAAATALTGDEWRPLWVVLAGVGATVMAVRPLGSVRWLRKVMVWLVLAATVYLFAQLLSEPLPGLTEGGWTGFGLATDTVIAVCVSYALLIGDYSRHSTPARELVPGRVGRLRRRGHRLHLARHRGVLDRRRPRRRRHRRAARGPGGCTRPADPRRGRGRRGVRQRLLDHDVGAQHGAATSTAAGCRSRSGSSPPRWRW